ncbi:MAG TPA: PadR family transcriptional regulator [Actinomycetota bacterium]|nr:PadR family transcriptional regulator [Actinomycetota bacterium]
MSSTPETDLPATSWAILGMLTFGDMSGYDLSKMVGASIGHFFSPAKSQIYSELRRLVGLGLATVEEVDQTDRPNKRIYSITPEGRNRLRAWLESSDVEPDSFRSPFLLKVFFGGLSSHEVLVTQVKAAHERAVEELAALERLESEIRHRPEYLHPNLVLRFGLAHTRASVDWTRDVLRELQQLEDHRAGLPASQLEKG